MTDLERARQLLADDPDEMDEAWLASIIAAARREGAMQEMLIAAEKADAAGFRRGYEAGRQGIEQAKDDIAQLKGDVEEWRGKLAEQCGKTLAAAEEMRKRAEEAIVNLRPVENMQEAAIAAIRALRSRND